MKMCFFVDYLQYNNVSKETYKYSKLMRETSQPFCRMTQLH